MPQKKTTKVIQLSSLYTLQLGECTYKPGSVVTVIDWLADLLVKEGKATYYHVLPIPEKVVPSYEPKSNH